MPEPMAIAVNIGRHVLRTVLAQRRNEAVRDLPLSELINVTTLDDYQRRALRRELETIVDTVSHRMEAFIDNEWRGLPEPDRRAAETAVVDTFNSYNLSDESFYSIDADPISLARSMRLTGNVQATARNLGGDAAELYSRLLDESCFLYCNLVVSLAPFVNRTVAELLARTSSLSQQVESVLQRLPVGTLDAPDGTTHDAEFCSRYLTHISTTQDYIELFGIDVNRYRPTATLSVAYISLSVTADFDKLSLAETGERLPESDDENEQGEAASLRVENALAGSSRILVRGEAGSGKTTLLSWLAITAARGAFKGKLAAWNGRIPFLIKLRRFVARDLPRPERYLDGVADPISGLMPQGWVHRQLARGNALLLVDGVDELPATERRAVRRWIHDILKQYPNTAAVVTARPAAANGAWLANEGFIPVALNRMGPADIKALIAHWHEAMCDAGHLPCEEHELPAYERTLLAKLDSTPHLQALATNPLMCAMLCALNLDRHKVLPPDRMAIYKAAIDMLLERRDLERGVVAEPGILLDLNAKLQLLQALAWRLSLNGRAEIDKGLAVDRFAERLHLMDKSDTDPIKVMDYLISRSGVIREPVVDRVDFVHRTFQEYLTAREIAEQGDIGFLIERAHLDTWQETVVMTAGHAHRPTRDELLNGLISRSENEERYRRRLKLIAASCLEAASTLDPQIRARVDGSLATLVPPRRRAEARSLAMAGPAVLRHVPRDSTELTTAAATSMIWTLGVIGGTDSLEILSEYAGDNRRQVSSQLLELCSYFEPKEYAEQVLNKIPAPFPFRINRSHVSSFRHVRGKHIERLSLSDVVNIAEDMHGLPPMEGLWASGDIPDISSLEQFADSLNDITLWSDSALYSPQPLQALKKLLGLRIGFPDLNDISFVTRLAPNLSTLWLSWLTANVDLSPISQLKVLKTLRFGARGQRIGSIRFLSDMPHISSFELNGAQPQGGLRELVELLPQITQLSFLSSNWIKDLDVLEGLEHLQALHLYSTSTHDLRPLRKLKKLRTIYLDCPKVRDYSPLKDLPVLQDCSVRIRYDESFDISFTKDLRGRVILYDRAGYAKAIYYKGNSTLIRVPKTI
jgi:hypothetical protein